MPRFYFDMREDGTFLCDEEGEEHPDLDAAERAACETAAELGRSKLPSGETRKVIIEVRNERKQRVLTATVRLEVNRVDPPPS
jgi:hypothetical protein